MVRKIGLGMALSGMLLMLGACGYSPGTRAVSGGLLGAGAGAGVAAVTGGQTGNWCADRRRGGCTRGSAHGSVSA